VPVRCDEKSPIDPNGPAPPPKVGCDQQSEHEAGPDVHDDYIRDAGFGPHSDALKQPRVGPLIDLNIMVLTGNVERTYAAMDQVLVMSDPGHERQNSM
jgi:hypothetical protein